MQKQNTRALRRNQSFMDEPDFMIAGHALRDSGAFRAATGCVLSRDREGAVVKSQARRHTGIIRMLVQIPLLRTFFAALAISVGSPGLRAAEVIEHLFRGITTIARTE